MMNSAVLIDSLFIVNLQHRLNFKSKLQVVIFTLTQLANLNCTIYEKKKKNRIKILYQNSKKHHKRKHNNINYKLLPLKFPYVFKSSSVIHPVYSLFDVTST